MRDLAIAVLREVGVDTGGCNIQFAVHPGTGRMVVIEMNPRVSRSSALASKATGFPIAKIAAKLAIGYTLDEIRNDITGETPASFEPTLDYVVVKVPRFAFEKFPTADRELTTHMKSVGEAMAIGRNFTEALGKAMRSTETSRAGWWTGADPDVGPADKDRLLAELAVPTDGRLYTIEQAMRAGATVAEVAAASGIDPWFIEQIATAQEVGGDVADAPVLTPELLRRAKRYGLSDRQIAALRPELAGEDGVRTLRLRTGIRPVFKTVDTCAAEFAAATPYHYSTYDEETEVAPQPERPKVLILGSGPNRIGQGIEFDYSCVHAAQALRAAGYETVMVNCNPETVSTDYDTSDRLYFEPLTLEDVLEVVHAEQESGTVAGVICTLGGQTPLGLAQRLKDAGVPILGTQPEAIHLAEDREEFSAVLAGAGLPAPRHGTASSFAEARDVAAEIGYPVLVRPSYVLGGRGMEIVYDETALAAYLIRHLADIGRADRTEHPILVDRFLDDAVELDVDALYDGERALPRRRDGAHRGGRHPLRRLGLRAAADHAGRGRRGRGPARHRRAGRPDRGARPAQRPVRAQGRRAVGPRGQPAGVAYGAVRVQGDGGPAGEGGRPDRARRDGRPAAQGGPAAGHRRRRRPARRRAGGGQGGGAAVPPVPPRRRVRRGHRARAGDALHRRGDGPRRRVRHGVREVPGGRVRVAADRRDGVRLDRQPGQAGGDPADHAAGRSRLPYPRHRGHRAGAAPARRPGRGRAALPAGHARAARLRASGSRTARSPWCSTRRGGRRATPARGWTGTRSAPPRSRPGSRA